MAQKTYTIDQSKKWDYENGFYLTCEPGRISKMLSHFEIYRKIVDLPGHVLEFGVYKGASLSRFLAFRDLLENATKRKVVGFDMFGKFPCELSLEEDKAFVERFEAAGGDGISKTLLEECLVKKGHTNFELVPGNILTTLPEFLNKYPALKISLLHIDVDVYEPSKLILNLLWDRIAPGGILVLDDYGTVAGETKAVDEFFDGKNVSFSVSLNHIPAYIVKK